MSHELAIVGGHQGFATEIGGGLKYIRIRLTGDPLGLAERVRDARGYLAQGHDVDVACRLSRDEDPFAALEILEAFVRALGRRAEVIDPPAIQNRRVARMLVRPA